MEQAESPRLARRRLAYALADMREDLLAQHGSEWTQTSVARRVGVTQQTLASIEGERTVPSEDALRGLLREYDRETEIDAFLARRARAKRKSAQWRGVDLTADPVGYADYVDLESGAATIESYELRLVPGILQSRAYAEHVIRRGQRSNRELDRKVDIRVGRRDAIMREHSPARLWMCVEEHALTHPAAPAEVMREQYALLRELGELDNVELQIVPRSAGAHVGMATSFSSLQFDSPRDPGLVAIETEIITVFFERPAEVRQYATIMDHLRAVSLEPDESAAMIETMRQEA